MNYVLQVVRGRSISTTLKLTDDITSLGRHDDCVIRIKSAQVSRRHCELYEVGGQLMIRDLGSSNGTFVNGKQVTGEQSLKHGDEFTVGAVTLRVAKSASPLIPAGEPPSKPKAGDTAVLDAIESTARRCRGRRVRNGVRRRRARTRDRGIPLAEDMAAEPVEPRPHRQEHRIERPDRHPRRSQKAGEAHEGKARTTPSPTSCSTSISTMTID